jgi:hypothetical protein
MAANRVLDEREELVALLVVDPLPGKREEPVD